MFLFQLSPSGWTVWSSNFHYADRDNLLMFVLSILFRLTQVVVWRKSQYLWKISNPKSFLAILPRFLANFLTIYALVLNWMQGRNRAERFKSLIPSYIHDSSVAVIVFHVASKCLLFFSIGLFFVVSLWCGLLLTSSMVESPRCFRLCSRNSVCTLVFSLAFIHCRELMKSVGKLW